MQCYDLRARGAKIARDSRNVSTHPRRHLPEGTAQPDPRRMESRPLNGSQVKRAAGRAGLKTAEYAGHSLRAGLATQAAMNGASELAIMKQTGHRSLATVRKYIREGSLFRDNAATKLGL